MKIFCETDQHIEVPYSSLKGVLLENLNLHRAQLENFDLSDTSFKNCNLRGAFLFKAKMIGCTFESTNLIVADLREVDLSNTNFVKCLVISTLFENANLLNTNLEGSDIEGANFKNANLRGANLNCIGIEKAIFEKAIFDSRTIWPKNFNAKEYGAEMK